MDKLSELSVSVSALLIDKGIALSSLPLALLTVSVGASATAFTLTAILALVTAVSPFSLSVLVAVTVKLKSASESAGGVIVSPLSSALVNLHVPSCLSFPADKLAPLGTPLITMDKLSELSVSV